MNKGKSIAGMEGWGYHLKFRLVLIEVKLEKTLKKVANITMKIS